ncbi:MAG: M28 family peptidase [Bacteroidia bacterium]
MKKIYVLVFLLLCFVSKNTLAQTNIISTNPVAEKIMLGNYNPNTYKATKVLNLPDTISNGINKRISPDSLKAYLEVLRTFKNRNTGSDTISKTIGIGAARRWVFSKFTQFSNANENRLIPSYLQFNQLICNQSQHRNIFAVLPGSDTSDKSIIIIEAHIDSRCQDGCDTACVAEGMEDNGSGTALVIELARVMSQYSYNHTIVFLLTIAEEQGLNGAEAFADYVQAKGIKVKAVLNNDVIGGVICGQTASQPGCSGAGLIDSLNVRLFSYGNFNSIWKGLARYTKLQYNTRIKPIAKVKMNVNIMTPEDRTGRGGDHIPFRQHNYAAIRLTAANENGNADVANAGYIDRQHTSSDILGTDTDNDKKIDSFFVDFNYLGRNAVINGCTAGMIGISPLTPDFTLSTDWISKLTVTITQQTQYQKYKVGLRTTTNDWDTVYTFSGTTFTFSVPNPATYIVSVCSVNNLGVESLFSKEIQTKISGINELNKPQQAVELLQNKPNPSDEATTISVMVNTHEKIKAAYISISDLTGKEVHKIPIELNNGMNEVEYNHGYHQSGTFIYSLIIDGKIIQSRRMVFTN